MLRRGKKVEEKWEEEKIQRKEKHEVTKRGNNNIYVLPVQGRFARFYIEIKRSISCHNTNDSSSIRSEWELFRFVRLIIHRLQQIVTTIIIIILANCCTSAGTFFRNHTGWWVNFKFFAIIRWTNQSGWNIETPTIIESIDMWSFPFLLSFQSYFF